jgi:transposase-like protein
MSKVRKQLTAEQRAQIVRRHLADKAPVSDLADEYGVQPSQIHLWVKQVVRARYRRAAAAGDRYVERLLHPLACRRCTGDRRNCRV